MKLAIIGWKYGLRKVSLTSLLIEELALGLIEARNVVLAIMDDKKVVITGESARLQSFGKQAEELGAVCELFDTGGQRGQSNVDVWIGKEGTENGYTDSSDEN